MEVLPLERHHPTHANGAALGALALMFRSPLRLTPRSERLLELATMLISLALDNARLRAEERALRRLAEQRAYDRLQFLARVNHELRTPLQSITGYIELLSHDADAPTPRQREILNHIEDSERILLGIIDSVAGLGRLEAGRMTYHLEAVTVVDVLSRLASVMTPLAQKQQVELDVDMPPRDLLARGDHGKIVQILINLATNAIKFTPAHGRVTLTARRVGSRIDFIVKDEGPGIPPDKLAAIFEPWVQFDQRRNYPLAGFGLGLTISRELASGMGGTLSVENATPPETGAVFTFSIRIHRADRAAWRSRRTPLPLGAAQQGSPEPIASIEPSPSIAQPPPNAPPA
jgi:signal transduction histidine kinase